MLEEHHEPLTRAAGNGLLDFGTDDEGVRRKRRKELVLAVITGQLLAFVIAVSAVFTKLLYDVHNVSSPALQNVIGYGLTFVLFLYPCGFPKELPHQDKKTVLALFFVAIADSQAAFFDNLAYGFGVSIASVGMLSSFTIPCVMVLSYCFLKVRYGRKHFTGVAVALLGLVCVVVADVIGVTSGSGNGPGGLDVNGTTESNSTSNSDEGLHDSVIGDILILVGCVFYAVSNVSTEAFVKTGSLFQYLVWLGFFSSFISLIQWGILEGPAALANAKDVGTVPALFFFHALTFVTLYWGCGMFLARFDAVVMNLSFLTTDVWGIIFGYFVFSEEIHALKFVGFVAIVIGVVLYNMESPKRLLELNKPSSKASSTIVGIGEEENDDMNIVSSVEEVDRHHRNGRGGGGVDEGEYHEMQVMDATTSRPSSQPPSHRDQIEPV